MDDKIKVTAQDMATQRQAVKKAGAATPAPAPVPQRKKPGHKASAPATFVRPAPAQGSPVDLIDKTLDLAAQAGGVAALKRLVDRLTDMQEWRSVTTGQTQSPLQLVSAAVNTPSCSSRRQCRCPAGATRRPGHCSLRKDGFSR